MIKICTRCFYPSTHPLGIAFNEEDICSGCLVHDEKYKINWNDKFIELEELVKSYRSTNTYDCIVPVSGSGDSFYIVHQVKNVLGMNPLLVTYNNHFNTAAGIRNLARLKTTFDCDLITMTVDPNKVRKITRETLLRNGSIYWHSIAGQTVFPVQIACKFKIPLIIWGVHQGLDQVGMFSHEDRVEMSRKYRHEHDLMGFEAEDLLNGFEGLAESEVSAFIYPDDSEVAAVGVRGVYLNNYMFWNSRLQHEAMIRSYKYESKTQTRTFDSYSNSSCWNYSDLHDFIKLIKHGFGKVLDHVSREIRLNQMTKSEGADLILRFLHLKPSHDMMFYDWLGVNQPGFNYVINQFRNPLFWQRAKSLDWEYIGPYSTDKLMSICGREEFSNPYRATPKGFSTDVENEYIVIGKGFV